MELYNQHTAAQDACYVSKYIPLDNPTFHLMTAIQHELHHNHQVNLFTSSCLWSFDKIFTIWTIGFIIHLVQVYFHHQVNLFALQVPVGGHLTEYYNLDYWIRHSFGSGIFQPSGQPFYKFLFVVI